MNSKSCRCLMTGFSKLTNCSSMYNTRARHHGQHISKKIFRSCQWKLNFENMKSFLKECRLVKCHVNSTYLLKLMLYASMRKIDASLHLKEGSFCMQIGKSTVAWCLQGLALQSAQCMFHLFM